MKENEVKKYFMSDYIYLPYSDKDSIVLNNNGLVKLNDQVTKYNGKSIYSPVSGKAFGFSKLYSVDGETGVLIIENDYKDLKNSILQVEDLYKVSIDVIKKTVGELNGEFNIRVNCNKLDNRDYYILYDNINIILETLNVISECYNTSVNILLNKKDLMTYNLLFSKLGTYPNIRVIFDNKIDNYKSLYDVIDIYDKLKNRWVRDYIYFCAIYDKTYNVFKVKKYSNVRDILINNGINFERLSVNGLNVNDKNFLLDDNVSYVEVK